MLRVLPRGIIASMENPENRRRSRRGIYWLPNLFTTAAMFGGFYAIVAAMNDRFQYAAVAIFVAMVLDGLDGRVARMTGTESDFGKEYDSLSDMVSFGVAPALVVYQWAFRGGVEITLGYAKLGWLAAFFYAVAAAMRLARFNARAAVQDKRFFQGLPSPSAAGLITGMVWLGHSQGFNGIAASIVAFTVTVLAGALMVSNFSYYSFKDLSPGQRIRFRWMLVIPLVIILIATQPPVMLFTLFLLYALSGPALSLFRWLRRRRSTFSGTGGPG